MKIAISTSVVQRGTSGIAQYLFALLNAFQDWVGPFEFVLYVLKEDMPLFARFAGRMDIISVDEKHRSPVKNIL